MVRLQCTKKHYIRTYITYFNDKTGLVGISPITENDYLIFHTAHFFERLNERLNLNLTLPEEIIRAYLSEAGTLHVGAMDEFAPGLKNILVATMQGFLLGTLDDIQRFYKINTFVTQDMLKGADAWDGALLKKQLDKYRSNLPYLFK